MLDPDVVLRLDRGAVPAGASRAVRGASAVVQLGFAFSGEGSAPDIIRYTLERQVPTG